MKLLPIFYQGRKFQSYGLAQLHKTSVHAYIKTYRLPNEISDSSPALWIKHTKLVQQSTC